jgi:hypothetical protein
VTVAAQAAAGTVSAISRRARQIPGDAAPDIKEERE